MQHIKIPDLTQSDIARFWSKVKTGTPEECWPWIPAIESGHHGRFGYRREGVLLAHRVSYFLSTGEQPSLHCCHRCDYPPCVNPRHLFLGTQEDNIRDMHSKNRAADMSGENHPQRRLSWDDVRTIRARYVPGKGNGSFALAREYGITVMHLLNIANNKCWKI